MTRSYFISIYPADKYIFMHMYIFPCEIQLIVNTRGHSRMSQAGCTCQKNSSNYKPRMLQAMIICDPEPVHTGTDENNLFQSCYWGSDMFIYLAHMGLCLLALTAPAGWQLFKSLSGLDSIPIPAELGGLRCGSHRDHRSDM